MKHTDTHQKSLKVKHSSSWNKKEFIHMTKWVVLINSIKNNWWQKMNFTVFWVMSTYLTISANMYKMFGTHLTLRQWEIIMIFINLIHAIILQVLDCLGMIQYVKNDRYKIRLSWFIFEVRHSSTYWYIWKFLKGLSETLKTWSMLLFYKSWTVLGWYSMSRMTNIKLELMTDIDIFQFNERGIWSDISYVANR